MITVTYKKRCSPLIKGRAVYYIKDISGNGNTVRLLIPECERGSVLIGGAAYPIRGGVCEMPVPNAADDITVVADGRQITAEAFAVSQGGITRAAVSGEDHAALREVCFMLEDALAGQDERIRVLEEKILGTPLFKFK